MPTLKRQLQRPTTLSRWKLHKYTQFEYTFIFQLSHFNPYNAEIFLYKLWRPKDFFQFEIIINVLVSSFRFIWIPMLWCHGCTAIINVLILSTWGPSLYVKIWRMKTVPALKGLNLVVMWSGDKSKSFSFTTYVYRCQILMYKDGPRAERVNAYFSVKSLYLKHK